MTKNLKILNNIRTNISDNTRAMQVLFSKIQDSSRGEIFILAELGKKLCKENKQDCEMFEITLNKI